MDVGGEAIAISDSAEDVDARTVFVRNLPFSLTDSQLEDIFSEVGPVRHCFTVKEKGSDQHRGFGFVQFAVTEDARRAVQEKNGALLQSRKIKVEVAKRRAPLDLRHPKFHSSKPESATGDEEQLSKSDFSKLESKKRKLAELQNAPPVKTANGDLVVGKKKLKPGGRPDSDVKADQEKEYDESQGSSKQRSARTVVVGGLVSTEMVEAVLAEAKKAGSIETIQKTFTDLELSSRGLAKDGCKQRAAAIVYLSVKAARLAVAMLHKKTVSGGVVWARQLGGEGSKLKQLRLIVRNLPFQVTEPTLRDLFSPAGFLWEITIPRKPDGLSKGFAFIGFTSKVDAEKAIELVNGKLVAKRPVAVDWAVAKKQYEAAVAPTTPVVVTDVDMDENESTASESELDDNGDGNDGESGSDKETSDALEHRGDTHVVVGKQSISDDRNMKQKKRGQVGLISEEHNEEIDGQSNKSGYVSEDTKHSSLQIRDRMEEIDMVKKILTKVVKSVHDHPSDDEEIVEALASEHPGKKQSKSKDQPTKKVVSKGKTEDTVTKLKSDDFSSPDVDVETKLSRTVFIRNLPAEAKVPELRKLFSEFGDIKSFRLVLHSITKRAKGNAFLEYAKQEAAEAAVAAAAKSGDELGLMLKGRAVSVSMAVDKDSARKIAKESFHKQVAEDKRNLALAKEGQLLVGTPAAEGVSKKDMAKRQQLEHEKATKLRSPNFHVSRTRLLVHNIPRTITQKDLKKLFIEAVKSRASKQNPVIKQVKILQDEDSQKSRGVAFLEFTEHQHALVALRVLNNNPATFNADSRPIVEFAIENSLILRKRAANAVQARNWSSKGAQGHQTYGLKNMGEKEKKVDNANKQKMKRGEGSYTSNEENDKFPNSGKPLVEGQGTPIKEDRKRKRRKDTRETTKTSKQGQGVQKTSVTDSTPGDLVNGGKLEARDGRKIKRTKTNGADRMAAQATKASSERAEAAVGPARQHGKLRSTPQTLGKRGIKNQIHQLSEIAQPVEQPSSAKVRVVSKDGKFKNFGIFESWASQKEIQVESKKRWNRGNGGDTEDRLDTLVAEYRTKYFSDVSKPTALKGVAAAPGDFRRWFE